MSNGEFIEYLIQHGIRPVGDLSKAPLEPVANGEVVATSVPLQRP